MVEFLQRNKTRKRKHQHEAKHMLKLTDYETGLAIYVDLDVIKSTRQLLGGRTRIDTATDMFLVRETVEDVMAGRFIDPKSRSGCRFLECDQSSCRYLRPRGHRNTI